MEIENFLDMFLLPRFIKWHFWDKPKKIQSFWNKVIGFYYYYFSIPLLTKTLFAPWKRQLITSDRPGFHLEEIFSKLTFNIFSRIIGATIRTVTILSGLVLIIFIIIINVITVIIWTVSPTLTWILFVKENEKKNNWLEKLINGKDTTPEKVFRKIIETDEGKFIFERLGIPIKQIKEELKDTSNRNETNNNIVIASRQPAEKQSQPSNIPTGSPQPRLWRDFAMTTTHIITALSDSWPPLSEFLEKNKIREEDIIGVAKWYEKLHRKRASLLTLENIFKTPGIGRDWAYGYTINLDKYSTPLPPSNLTFKTLIGRGKEISQIEEILSKKGESNVIISGEPGTGRHAVVYELARRINLGTVSPKLMNKRILELPMHTLVGETPNLITAKKKVTEILEEAVWAGNIILVIDEFDKYISDGNGRIDLTDVFEEILKGSGLQILGIVTDDNYHRFIQENKNLNVLFEKVVIEKPDNHAVLETLEMTVVPVLEVENEVTITYQALLETIKDADLYITKTPFPEKAIDLLDEAVIFTKNHFKINVITAYHIDTFLEEKAKVPIKEIGILEKEKLIHLEEFLHKRIVNQKEAISTVAETLRRGRLNISDRKKPLGSFLFIGPTGVGKTETAKALSEFYFGSEEKIIRFDMSEYQEEFGIGRLIGRSDGTPGELTDKINDNPFSLLLLDEIEKTDKKILNILMTIMDEGYIADANGNRIICNNLFVIATSNAGAEFIREEIMKGSKEVLKEKLIDHILRKGIFSPEFINRFDEVVAFTPLSEGHLREVARLQLEKLNKRLEGKEISVNISNNLIKYLAVHGYDPVFGARAMQRVIANTVETQVAHRLLEGKVEKGEKIEITIND